MTLPVVSFEDLTPAHFEEYPVWGRFGENDDLFTPLIETDPIPLEAAAEFIKADFSTPSGFQFEGLVITSAAFAIGLFVNGAKFLFNRYLPEMAHEDLKKLQLAVGEEIQVFPLEYRTNFRMEGDEDLIAELLTHSASREQDV